MKRIRLIALCFTLTTVLIRAGTLLAAPGKAQGSGEDDAGGGLVS